MADSTRRQFLHAALVASAGLGAGVSNLPAIEPIRRIGKPHIRLSIAAYSYRKYLDLTLKPKPPWTLDDFIDEAATLNLDAVEPTAYYFAKTTPEYLAHLKGRCTRLGLDVSGTGIRNNFCTPDPAQLRAEIAHVKTWVDYSARLGAKTVRIFAGPLAKGDTKEKARARCVEAIQEACDYAGQQGLYLALENHPGPVSTLEETLEVLRAVKHDWFGLNWDPGDFHSADPYTDLTIVAPYAVTVQMKTEIQREGKPREPADFKRLIDILRSAGYRGYVALEYEAAEEPKTAIPRHVAELQRLAYAR
jgi:sugar phosphate isomerase/epimerase